MSSEFDLIRRHFTRAVQHTDLGIGDDGALLRVRPGMQLVVSTDMLVSGTHFFPDAEPFALGWKTAAVNISDMAAMSAEPRWITLALALPGADEAWVAALAAGFAACCEAFGVDWIGGDTTRGPLNLCPTVFGEVPVGAAVTRGGARPDEDLWVSGAPGLAALGLKYLQSGLALGAAAQDCLAALHQPQPRVALGLALRGVATAMLDVSDGLCGDLGHMLAASRCGALLDHDCLPLERPLAACGDAELALAVVLGGGDDYELLFSAPLEARNALVALSRQLNLPLHRIGTLTERSGTIELLRAGQVQQLAARGYDHFASRQAG